MLNDLMGNIILKQLKTFNLRNNFIAFPFLKMALAGGIFPVNRPIAELTKNHLFSYR